MSRRHLALAAAAALAAPAIALAPGPTPAALAAADGCAAGVESDFDGDGFTDTAVGDPTATAGDQSEAGRVVVLYGDADGLVGEGARDLLWQGHENVGGVAEPGDHFGAALAAADLDCDGFTDLVVGAPQEDINGQSDSGYVQVLWGSTGGLGIDRVSIQYTQVSFGRTITAGDSFGAAVDALEDVGQGGTPAPDAYALAIGVPGGNVKERNDAGWVGVQVAVDGGSQAFAVDLDSPGVPGTADGGDRFGAAVALGYLVGSSGTVDLAVGAPRDDIGSVVDAGSVTVLRDVYDEPTGVRLTQNSRGVPDKVERGDQLGRSVDALTAGGLTRIAVGVPSEDLGTVKDAGAVQIFVANAAPGAFLTQDTTNVADRAERGDGFGDRVRWGAPGGGAPFRLAVGVPLEDTSAGTDAGIVQVFPATELGNEKTYTQGSPGIPGIAAAGDRFGRSLAFVDGSEEHVLLVGVPDDAQYATGAVVVVPTAGGTPRIWRPGPGGVPTGATAFGGAVSGVTG